MLDFLYGPDYINPLLRAGFTIGKDLYDGRTWNDNSYSDWLTNGEWNEHKYNEYLLYNVIPGMKQYTEYLTTLYDDKSYMKNNGLTWDDIRRPWKLKSTSSAVNGMHFGLNFVSKNVEKLYR